MPNGLIKFAFSFPGMTIWLFILQCPLSIFVFGNRPADAAVTTSFISVILAWTSWRRIKKDNPGFLKDLEENRSGQLRRFKKLVQQGRLPGDNSEFPRFAEYLARIQKSLKRSSPIQEKLILCFFVIMGTVSFASKDYRVSVLVLFIIAMLCWSIRVSARNRRVIPQLQEELCQHYKQDDDPSSTSK